MKTMLLLRTRDYSFLPLKVERLQLKGNFGSAFLPFTAHSKQLRYFYKINILNLSQSRYDGAFRSWLIPISPVHSLWSPDLLLSRSQVKPVLVVEL